MATLSATSVPNNAGTVVTISTAADVAGDTIAWLPGKRRVLLIKNADASQMTVTVTAQNANKKVEGDTYAVPAIAQAVASGEVRAIPITEAYADASNNVAITYSAVTSVTVRVIEVEV